MRIACGIACLLGICAVPVSAQLYLETGGGQGRLDQLSSSSLTALGGGVDALIGASRLQVDGNAQERFGLGSTGMITGRWSYRIAAHAWQFDAGPDVEVARDIAAPWASAFGGHVAAQRAFGPFALRAEWEQGVANTGANFGTWYRPTLSAEFQAGAFRLGTSWQSTVNPDTSTGSGTGVTSDTGAQGSPEPSRHGERDVHDISAHMGWSAGMVSITGRVGRRFGLAIQPQTWWEGQAALRLTALMSVTAQTGRLASDVLLGLRGGQYTTVGLRVNLPQPVHPVPTRGRATTASTEVERETTDMVHVWFALPTGIRRAAMTSDLTNWQSVMLSPGRDGRWGAVLHAGAGVYRVDVRTDDGPWFAPAGLATADDGFGSRVGLLVIQP